MTEEMDVQKSSYLFERYAFIFILILLSVAIWFKFLPLIIVTSFLLLLSVLIIVWKEKSLHHVHVEITPTKTRLFAGETFQIQTSVDNDKWLPLVWLELDFPESEYVLLGANNKHKYILRFLWLMSYQHVKRKIDGQGFKRGVYHTGETIIKSGDGFRFTEKKQQIQTNHMLYIYPALVPVHVPAFHTSMKWEVKGGHGGILEDPLLISGTREYEVGDNWNRLNTRATVRTGKLQTNRYERITTKQLILYINVRGFTINEHKYPSDLHKQQKYEAQMNEELEFFLSIITSFVVAYHEKGVHVGYLSNGLNYYNQKQPFVMPTAILTVVLDHIALLTEGPITDKISPLDEALLTKKVQAPLFVFCRSITEDDYQWFMKNKANISIQFYYVHRTHVSMKLGSNASQIDSLLANMVVNKG